MYCVSEQRVKDGGDVFMSHQEPGSTVYIEVVYPQIIHNTLLRSDVFICSCRAQLKHITVAALLTLPVHCGLY